MFKKPKQYKINRKQKRCQSIISKEIDVASSETPTKFLAICNAGLSTGLQEEQLLSEALKHGNVEEVIMIPKKSYCFLRCNDTENAERIFTAMHAQSNLGQNDGIIYLSYFESVPEVENPWKNSYPPGLIVLEDFITEEEEKVLLKAMLNEECLQNNVESSLKHRKVKHYGYEFLYGSNQVDPQKPLSSKIPEESYFLWPRLKEKVPNIMWCEPDQLTVNQYSPGQGIPPHVDTHSAFLDPILSLSLEGETVMEFKRRSSHASVLLPRRSLLIMSGESRYDWTHAIVPRRIDFVPSESGGLTARHRNNRTSLTFRKLRKAACDCSYPTHCDSKRKNISEINRPTLEEVAEKLELNNVHRVYDEIANHFSETRHTPWPKVAEFINSFEKGSILLDIGCGNGKYLKVNENIAKIGCDRSGELLKVCCGNNFNVFKCDCLSVPFRDNSVNGCLSIAVIHHLATAERRLKAISEMVRILTPGGKALIYVWSKNQQADAKKSSYLRQNKAPEKRPASNQEIDLTKSDIDLPVHVNRTQFQDRDVFVPWKLKSKESQDSNCILLRFYHVFEEDELENLCKQVDGIKILQLYYDQGNWCVIFEKL